MKIHKHNYKELLPEASMDIQTVMAGRFIPIRHTLFGNNQIRYLEPEDIIHSMQKRLQAPQSKSKDLNQWRWIKMIELCQKLIAKEDNDSAA
jgi:hypothetical protein